MDLEGYEGIYSGISAAAKPADYGAWLHTHRDAMRTKRTRRATKGRARRSRRSVVPKDALGFSTAIRRFDSDVYTTTVTALITGNQLLTVDAGDATMYSSVLSGINLFAAARGFVNLSDRFQMCMVHSGTMEVNLANHGSGANTQVVVAYLPALGGQGLPGTVGIWNMEASGSRVKQLNVNNPKAKWSLLGSVTGEAFATSLLTGYVGMNLNKVYIATSNTNGGRMPNAFFGNVVVYSPGMVLNSAQTPGMVTFKFTFKISFACPQMAPGQ